MAGVVKIVRLGLVLLALIFVARPATAQLSGNGAVATEVRIEGAQRIEADTIRSYLSIKVGDPISPRALDDSLKKRSPPGCSPTSSSARKPPP